MQNGVSTILTLVLPAARTSIWSLLHPGEKKDNNDHFHSKFAIIVFKVNSYSFSVVENEQIRTRFLALSTFVACLPPEKPRDIAFENNSTLTFIDQNELTPKKHLINIPTLSYFSDEYNVKVLL